MRLEMAIDHPTRRRAVRLLVVKGSMATPEVAKHLGLPLTRTAHHLKVLAGVNVLSVEFGEGRERVYAENLDTCPPWVREAVEAGDEPGGTEELGT